MYVCCADNGDILGVGAAAPTSHINVANRTLPHNGHPGL